jgi:hypothetical protein
MFPTQAIVVDISVKQWLVKRGSESVADELWQKVWQWNGGPRGSFKETLSQRPFHLSPFQCRIRGNMSLVHDPCANPIITFLYGSQLGERASLEMRNCHMCGRARGPRGGSAKPLAVTSTACIPVFTRVRNVLVCVRRMHRVHVPWHSGANAIKFGFLFLLFSCS